MADEDVHKTAITTPFGLFEFTRMPFGLRNAAQTFQRFIDTVLRGLSFSYAYIDDVLIASTSEEEHKHHLRLVFERFKEYGVLIHPSKCEFGVSSLQFLGHVVDANGIRPMESKVSAVLDFPRPLPQRQLREFLGMINFYHRFIPHCAQVLQPLHTLLTRAHAKSELQWSQCCISAFNAAKEALAQATLLFHPTPDAPTVIMTDASDIAVGAVLQQFVNNQWQPISYFSRKLSHTERRYSTFDRELLAVYLAIKHFRHFLEGRVFSVYTDHKPLTFSLHTKSDTHSPRQLRHLDFIAQFTSDIRHIQGRHNPVADALSRVELNAVDSVSPPVVDFEAMAAAQDNCRFLSDESPHHSLTLHPIPLPNSTNSIICDFLMECHALLFHLPSGKLFLMPCTLCLILVSRLLKNLSVNVLSGPRCTLSSSGGHGHVFHVNDRRSFDIPFPLWHPFLHQMLDLTTFILILWDLSLLLMDKRTCSLVSIGSLAGQRLFLSQISLLPLLLALWFPGGSHVSVFLQLSPQTEVVSLSHPFGHNSWQYWALLVATPPLIIQSPMVWWNGFTVS